jgi:hypothetical protein
MKISRYDLLEYSSGRGYIDNPYEFFNLYVRGDASVAWIIEGTGIFSLNLSDMYQRVYAENTSYHMLSVYVNGTLVKVDNSALTETSDFGLSIELTDQTSYVELVFSSPANSEDNLTFVKKLTSFISEEQPRTTEAPREEVTPVNMSEHDLIKANGIKIANVDLGSSCGAYRIQVLPQTGEFHYIDEELWFNGDMRDERDYLVSVRAIRMDGSVITSKDINFTIADCDSSANCELIEIEDGAGRVPSTPGGQNGNGSGDAPVNTQINPPDNLRDTFVDCGSRVDDPEVISSTLILEWDKPDGSLLTDFQLSRGNTFNLVSLEYTALFNDTIELLLDEGLTFFFRVRARMSDSSAVSEWSEPLLFNSNGQSQCDTPQSGPAEPETANVICRTGLNPGNGNNEEGGNGETGGGGDSGGGDNTPTPADPTPPSGPDGCFGSGCGDGDSENPSPNTPGSYPTNPNSPGGCIGPGCSPGSEPQPPGTGGGGGGGGGDAGGGNPGGETGPETNPPTLPIPSVPTCNGVILQTVFRGWILKGSPTSPCEVEIKWSDRGEGCDAYFTRIGVESGGLVLPPFGLSESSTEDNPTVQDLNFTCPDCVQVCVKGDAVQISWELVSQAFDYEGNPDGEPYVSASATQMALDTCNCEDATDISSWLANPDPIETGGITYTYSQEAISITPLNGSVALHKPFPSNVFAVTSTLKAEGDQTDQSTNSQHVKRKMVVVKCEDEVWQNVTEEYIGCEVVFHGSFVGDLNDNSKFATYKDSWLMSTLTHEYCQDTTANWPLMGCLDIAEFSNSKPFGSDNWDLESPLCVTCCEQGSSSSWQDQQPMEMSSTNNVVHGNRLASTVGEYNNVNCLGGQIKDPNLNGHTAKTGIKPFNRTIVAPCSLPVPNTIVEDQYGIANLHYTTGNTYYIEPTQTGTSPQWPGCQQGEVCTRWINNSIATEYSTIDTICSPDVQGGTNWQMYTLTPDVNNATVYTRKVRYQCPGGDASSTDRYSVSTNRGNNAPIPQVISNLETNPPIQNNNTGDWTKDSIGNDGYRVGAARYKWTTWGAGVVMSDGPANPLP